MKPQPGNEKPLSKTALKNQRKHEAKKAAKQVLGTLIASKPKQTKPAKLAHALKLKSCSPKTLTVRLWNVVVDLKLQDYEAILSLSRLLQEIVQLEI